jgi:hypothetical protein
VDHRTVRDLAISFAAAAALALLITHSPPVPAIQFISEMLGVPGLMFVMITGCSVHSDCSLPRYSITLYIGLIGVWGVVTFVAIRAVRRYRRSRPTSERNAA